MKTHRLTYRLRLCAGSRIAICIVAIALSSLTARAGWPWFSGYLNPANSYRIYAFTDWDTPLFGAGIFPDTDCLGVAPPGYRVDGHVVFEADGAGNCVVIESTGSYAGTETLGSIHPVVSTQFGGWWQNPGSAPASDTRHDWNNNFLNVVADLVPSLTIAGSGTGYHSVSWPTNAQGYVLECSTNLLAGNWLETTNEVGIVGTNYSVTVRPPPGTMFFRLKR